MTFTIHSAKPFLQAAAIAIGQMLATSQAQAATETAIVAGGCFWCVETNFESVAGVKTVVSGFTGGTVKDPTYDDVTHSDTGHYEAVEITFDNARVSYGEIVRLFLRSTDVLDAGGQFCDRGNSYRSAIFATQAQKATAEAELATAAADLGKSIVTPVLAAQPFYPAEAYHQDYYKQSDIILTRRGPKSKANAYTFYRNACGRDARIEALWGAAATFVH